jgi:hypothetical protein
VKPAEEKSAEIMTATKQNDFPLVKRRSEKQIAWSRQLGQNSQKFKKENEKKKNNYMKKGKKKNYKKILNYLILKK